MKTVNKLSVEEAASTCDQKTIRTEVEKHENWQAFEHIPGLDLIEGKEIMKIEAENTHVPDKDFDKTHEAAERHSKNMQHVSDQIPGIDLSEVEKTTQLDLKDIQNREASDLSLSVNDGTDTQANPILHNSLKPETEKIDLRSIAEQQMIDEKVIDQENDVVPNEVNNQEKTQDHMNAEENETKDATAADADNRRSDKKSISSEKNLLNNLESINNDNCNNPKAIDSIQNIKVEVRCHENKDRAVSRKRDKNYRELDEDRIKGHRGHEVTSRKAEDNIKSREKKEQKDYGQIKNNVKCEGIGGQKREERERNRSRSRTQHQSRRNRSRNRSLEVNGSQRERPKSNDLKKRSGSRSRSSSEKKCDNTR